MPVFGRLNDSGVKGYEEEKGVSKFKGGKTTELNQCAVELLKKRGRKMVA